MGGVRLRSRADEPSNPHSPNRDPASLRRSRRRGAGRGSLAPDTVGVDRRRGSLLPGRPPRARVPRRNGKGGIGRSSPPVLWHGTARGTRDDCRPVRFLSFSFHGRPGFFALMKERVVSGLDCDLHRHDVDDGRYRLGVPVHRSSPVESMMHRYRDVTIQII